MQTPTAVEILTAELEKAQAAQARQWQEWETRISELKYSISMLTGKEPAVIQTERFDDESPDYIKNTEDGI